MDITSMLYVSGRALMALEKQGFTVEQSFDYDWAVEEMISLGKPYLTPNMDPARNDFTPENCYWLILRHGGAVVGGIGARRDDLGRETLGSFWRRSMKRQYTSERDEVIQSVDSFIDHDVRGTVTYFGDLFLHDDYRGEGNHLRLFTMYCQLNAALNWRSDWSYSFIGFDRAEGGGSFTYGFAKTIPGAQVWKSEKANRRSTECCVISSLGDIAQIANFYMANPSMLREFHAPDLPQESLRA